MVEAGCDEAGRGCLAGSVYAAAVILPPGYQNAELNDSKKLTDKKRKALREQIERARVTASICLLQLPASLPRPIVMITWMRWQKNIRSTTGKATRVILPRSIVLPSGNLEPLHIIA